MIFKPFHPRTISFAILLFEHIYIYISKYLYYKGTVSLKYFDEFLWRNIKKKKMTRKIQSKFTSSAVKLTLRKIDFAFHRA